MHQILLNADPQNFLLGRKNISLYCAFCHNFHALRFVLTAFAPLAVAICALIVDTLVSLANEHATAYFPTLQSIRSQNIDAIPARAPCRGD
jgi:hypothetical protein